jgi:SulP family sulfate permease
VTVGFTAAIAVTILASQLKDLAGLTLAGPEPGPLLPKLAALAAAAPTVNPAAVAAGLGVAGLIFLIRKLRPTWPGMLIALVIASVLALLVPGADLETIGSRFGEIPHGLPAPRLPHFTWNAALQVLPTALSFTLLGAVESLLSAKVADSMTGRVHRSSMELIAQGVANMASALFGGISVTGTIARTATNIRAGAKSPLSGVFHSFFLLAFILLAAPLAAFIPLSALAGVLVVVAWNMAEKPEIAALLRARGAGALALGATFLVTLLHDLTAGIIAGCLVAVMAAALRARRS